MFPYKLNHAHPAGDDSVGGLLHGVGHYFGHLSDVVMIDSNMLAAERLGGADYDGDMIRTIT
ncbi:MAG: hypothetical protein IIW82_07665, partial [Clostridia bacterium]|nr:hypothetical protein [Clostridia bacterium]